jgi:hypothetical protein
MKTNVTINGVEYSLDLEKAKELGVLEEKDLRCKSWEEFKLKCRGNKGYYMDSASGEIYHPVNPLGIGEQLTQQEAIAIQAFSKLLKLRRDWIGNWDPDWTRNIEKYSIVCENNIVDVMLSGYITHPFSFPTKKMAKEFLKCFKDLFEQCKCLI